MLDASIGLNIAIQIFEDLRAKVLICSEESFFEWGREQKWLDIETGYDGDLLNDLHDMHVDNWFEWKENL
jgi:hypothetical protein